MEPQTRKPGRPQSVHRQKLAEISLELTPDILATLQNSADLYFEPGEVQQRFEAHVAAESFDPTSIKIER